MSNVTLLSSCSLRWHGVSLVNSVCFIALKYYTGTSGFSFSCLFVCLFLVACLYVIMKSEVSINCLPQLCPIYFLRLNWSSLCWLGWCTSLRDTLVCTSSVLRLEACASAAGFSMDSGVQTQVHMLCSKHLPSCKVKEWAVSLAWKSGFSFGKGTTLVLLIYWEW